MITFPGEGNRLKTARTMVPRTAEFRPYRDARDDRANIELMEAAAAALGRVTQERPDLVAAGIRPDDLYETVMESQGLRGRWEAAFGGEEQGRDLFGLVAWTYFFGHDATWHGTPSAEGTGKGAWSFVPKFRPGDWVGDAAGGIVQCGKVVSGPDANGFYLVQFVGAFNEMETTRIRETDLGTVAGPCF